MTSPVDFRIRAPVPDDTNFIVNSWVGAARQSDMKTRNIDSHHFNAWMTPECNRVLKRAYVLVATALDDESVIYGFSVFEKNLVHIVYVRKHLRRLGIGRFLLPQTDVPNAAFSTWTSDCSEWILNKYPKAKYLPLWLGDAVHGRQAG